MSLINDALKRAKEAQQKNPPSPAPELPLRPVEATQQTGRRSGLALPMIFGVALVLLAVLLWQGSQRRVTPPQTAPPVVQAVSPAQPTPATIAAPQPPIPAKQTDLALQPGSPPATPIAAAAPEVATPPATVIETASTAPPAIPSPDSNAVSATVAASPPQPAPLKLQGILYRRANPLAVINGKTVGVGDRVGEATVAAIRPDSTDIVVAGETIKLSLSQ